MSDEKGGREGSAAARIARSAWGGARAGWAETPAAERRRFLVRLGIALVLCAAASALSALLLREVAVDGPLPGDTAVDAWTDELLSVHTGLWVGAWTSTAMVTPLLAMVLVLAARAGRWDRVVIALVSYIASKTILMAGWLTWHRTRPADVADGLLIPEGLSSYPSGHTVQAVAIYGMLALWWSGSTSRRGEKALAWVLLLLGTAVVAAGRIRIGAHYPSDAVGGAALGALWIAGLVWAGAPAGPRSRESA